MEIVPSFTNRPLEQIEAQGQGAAQAMTSTDQKIASIRSSLFQTPHVKATQPMSHASENTHPSPKVNQVFNPILEELLKPLKRSDFENSLRPLKGNTHEKKLRPFEKERFENLLRELENKIFGAEFFKRKSAYMDKVAFSLMAYRRRNGDESLLNKVKEAPDLFFKNPELFVVLLNSELKYLSRFPKFTSALDPYWDTGQAILFVNHLLQCQDQGILTFSEAKDSFNQLIEQQTRFNKLIENLPENFDTLVFSPHLHEEERSALNHLREKSEQGGQLIFTQLGLPNSLDPTMLRTYIQLGTDLQTLPPGRDTFHYVPKQRGILGHAAYAITAEGKAFVVSDYLAAGSYKKVSSTLDILTGKRFIRATIRGDKTSRETAEGLMEVKLLEQLAAVHNPHILSPFTAVSQINQKMVMIGKRYKGDGTSLHQATIKGKLQAFADVAAGLSAMHNKGLVHLDFKPDNFLVDEEGRAVVHDLGATKSIGENQTVGTSWNAPPELFKSPAQPAYDSWTLGATMLDLLDEGGLFVKPTLNDLSEDLHDALYIKDDRRTLKEYTEAVSRYIPDIEQCISIIRKYLLNQKNSQEDEQRISNVVDLCERLMKAVPAERLSVAKAAEELKKLYESA